MGLYLNDTKRFSSVEQAIVQYFAWEQQCGRGIPLDEVFVDGGKAKASLEWIDTYSQIGLYMSKLEYPGICVLGFYYFYRYSEREIAKMLKYPQGRIKDVRHRAIKQMDASLREIKMI